MRIPCAGARNLLRNQYQRWRASVFLKTITSECANIPAFSYLGSSGLHHVILPNAVSNLARILSRGLKNWNKPRLINGLISPPKGLPFFTSRSSSTEGRSCGPTAGNPDKQFFRSGPERAPAVRKTNGQIAEFRPPQGGSGVDCPLGSPGGSEPACSVSGDSRPFTGDQRGYQAERYLVPDPDGSAYQAEGRRGDMRDHVQHHDHNLSRHRQPLQSGSFRHVTLRDIDCCK